MAFIRQAVIDYKCYYMLLYAMAWIYKEAPPTMHIACEHICHTLWYSDKLKWKSLGFCRICWMRLQPSLLWSNMSVMASPITTRQFFQQFVHANDKEIIKAAHYWPLWGEPQVISGFCHKGPVMLQLFPCRYGHFNSSIVDFSYFFIDKFYKKVHTPLHSAQAIQL